MKYKLFFCMGFAFFMLIQIHAETSYSLTDISSLGEPDWTYVAGGEVLTQPKRAGNGYLYILDGRLSLLLSSKGKPLWINFSKTKPSTFFYINHDNISYIVAASTNLKMLNPDGKEIWTVDTGFEITEDPKQGRDGRIFVRGKNELACYGTRGALKWKISIANQDSSIPILELQDGSLVIFSQDSSSSYSRCIRLSPFGKILKEYQIEKKIKSAYSTPYGILIFTGDSSLALIHLEGTEFKSAWVLNQDKTGITGDISFICNDMEEGKAAAVYGKDYASAIIFNIRDGHIDSNFSSQLIRKSGLKYAGQSVQGFILADKNYASCFDKSGLPLWTLSYGDKKDWNYMYATVEGDIVFCAENWTIEAWCVNQTTQTAVYSDNKTTYKKDYTDFYKNETSSSALVPNNNQIYQNIKNGNYGDKEDTYLLYIKEECQKILQDFNTISYDSRESKPYYQSDTQSAKDIFYLAGAAQSTEFNRTLCSLLKTITDKDLLKVLIRQCGRIGYDTDYQMLSAFYYILQNKNIDKDNELTCAICDACYDICLYMGGEALNSSGKYIFSYLMTPRFNSKQNLYARETLKKIAQYGI